MRKQLLVLTAATLLSSGAFAMEPYFQAQVGQSTFDADVDLGDDTDTYFGLGVGFGVSDYLAFEISYKDFGEASENSAVADVTAEATAFDVAAVGMLPVGANFILFGKIGLDVWETETTIKALNRSWNESDDGADLFFALGAAFAISQSTDIHLEYQMHSFEYKIGEDSLLGDQGDLDVDVFSVGINIGF